MTTTSERRQVLADIWGRWQAESRRPLTTEEIEAILPDEVLHTDDLPSQLRQLRTYIEERELEQKAARQLRDRGIAAMRTTGAARLEIAELSGTSVPHVAACIGRRVPGVHSP